MTLKTKLAYASEQVVSMACKVSEMRDLGTIVLLPEGRKVFGEGGKEWALMVEWCRIVCDGVVFNSC